MPRDRKKYTPKPLILMVPTDEPDTYEVKILEGGKQDLPEDWLELYNKGARIFRVHRELKPKISI